jgi:hypothetical protein
MNLRTILYIIVGLIVFLGIWLFNMIGGIALLIGFGFGLLLHNYFSLIFKNLQKNIYLSEKAEMKHKLVQLEAEIKKLKEDN